MGTSGTPEWSRSRYWLCHFLHSRHERPRVPWSVATGGDDLPGLDRWLAAVQGRAGLSEPWVIPQAAIHHADDPAYVQTLRLLLREQAHQASLIARWRACRNTAATWAPRHHPLLDAGQALGVRYTLSVILLDDLLDLAMARRLSAAVSDPALAAILDTLRHDRSAHLAFIVERLTMEFADFNAMRRNLRRLRLRGMFAASLASHVLEHRRLLRHLNHRPAAFAAEQWATFNGLLERMVPYRREALIAALLSQQREPYGRARMGD